MRVLRNIFEIVGKVNNNDKVKNDRLVMIDNTVDPAIKGVIEEMALGEELFETLAAGDALIERIVSTGQTTPEDQWYDQEKDEWVILLQGEAKLLFMEGEEVTLRKGDYLFIRAHEKHRVTYTSSDPPSVWIAVHANLSPC